MRSIKALGAVLLTVGLMACGGGDDPAPAVMTVDSTGVSTIDTAVLSSVLVTYPLAPLSTAETDSLAFMREEEQLAHDVYIASAARWAPAIFDNIAASEATHSAAVKLLLDRYQLPDPLAGLPNGTFKSPAFQTLYDQLTSDSQVSLIEALKVGLAIEELDMRDIAAQKASIDNADILMVYDHLLRGSRNHLRAFWKVLLQQGGTYVPQYITQTEFDAIVNSAVETGA